MFQSCQKPDELPEIAQPAGLREELTEDDLEIHNPLHCTHHSLSNSTLEERVGFIGTDSVRYQVTNDGVYLIEGDIAVPAEMISTVPTDENAIYNRSATLPNVNLWPNGKVYYKFAPNLSTTLRNIFLTACQKWNQYTGIQFILRTNQPNYIYVFTDGSSNYSYLGMKGGMQNLCLTVPNVGVAIHEIGHALCLVHEHQRSDRNTKIWVNPIYANQSPFVRYTNSYNYGSFDWNSIMLYPSKYKNGQWDMLKLSNSQPFNNTIEYWQSQGSYALPSVGDINHINYRY